MRKLGGMTPEERQVMGPKLNALKDEINSALAAKKEALADAALDERLKAEWLDVTLPPRPRNQGTIHPVSQVTEEVTAILADMGFAVAEGPQIESDWYNFDALNIPGHHPARTEMDTFYMARAEGDNRPPHVLRTHTSPVQIRAMQALGMGFDPVWLGILITLLLETALITPPVGVNLYIVHGIRKSGSMNDVIIGAAPFVITMFVMIGLLVLFPQLALFLPQTFSG